MTPIIPYSAEKDDLYYPAKHAVFFAGGRPASEDALCAEMARLAYCQQDTSFAFDQPRISKVLAGVGFTDCRFCESDCRPDGKGTHCFVAIQEDDQDRQQLAVVSFRGTDKDDPTDLMDDFNAWPESWTPGGKVHTGFANALAEVQPKLNLILDQLQCRTLYTGHSLGAALATLLASLRKPDALYTFGSPRVGDGTFVASLAAVANHRYVDCCDIVTRVPPELFGYIHLGTPLYIALDRQVTDNPPPKFVADDRLQAEEDYLKNYSWRIGDLAVRDLADHAPVNYVAAVK